ncbi:4-hydroxythreonine-4-phosphate dehydrogenase [Brevibacterium sanguinis]|uniref:4-hydroxythreonine-4-phosphate dehydrogenase n=2 Tax=Brevibacterium TaxID=1696 RepID=A0A366IGH2_9MICO|nr:MULTISPECIES: 4-hydroxythreonine-4-phosphate dehydrogenase PdxA [Brevibacterium]RBP63588.1 4-hydroxythreonine-4-phosphate dehydrogenase [Brevibacterium sanguinis]RBP70247.1 4-hydroxythreonine-4-phosphate dehydrogenase [Brevibacterium celere]
MTAPVLAVTVGDPVGIGPEITAQVLSEFAGRDDQHGVAVADLAVMRRAVEVLGLDVELRTITDWSTPSVGAGVIDVFDIGVLGDDLPEWGVVDARAGQASVTAIEVATKAAMDQEIAGIVTGPINKEAVWKSGSKHLGHTEMLGELTGVTKQDTMFVVEDTKVPDHKLQIFFATRHMSLRKALDALTVDTQVDSILRAHRALQLYGVDSPRLAVAALNPHGGENGAFGDEEIEILRPAVERVNAESGLEVAGPIPADSVFHHGLIGRYDGILSQYHDQGHIASKTYDFDGTISVTVGLPILRTSVDHGTAFDIAGRGIADAGTMRSAYAAAIGYAPYVDGIRAEYLPQ